MLHTADAEVTEVHMSLWKRILDTLIDPNIILLLMSLGVLGITVEIFNPGLIFPGDVRRDLRSSSASSASQVLPVSWAGLLLMLLAAGFFAAEPFLPSHGALTLAGLVSFVFGSLMLFDPAGSAYQVSLWVVLAIAGTLAALLRLRDVEGHPGAAASRRPGTRSMIGELGVVRRRSTPRARVRARRALARAAGGRSRSRRPATPVVVEALDEVLVLAVRPVAEARRPATPPTQSSVVAAPASPSSPSSSSCCPPVRRGQGRCANTSAA